ncbi:kelch-like protein 10 [Sebastes umbrosus]|uniref:kelch-like protein 10 n=1 Tax=Sebastes umbrosus TaxID=72105 RepID=UPI00189E14D1|nr:kelch-like protein 10 [Sebastes umbrosus]
MSSNMIFNKLRLKGLLCNAVIRVDSVEFKVHRIVLCNCSPYFRRLFCGKSSISEQQVYSFPQVSPNIMSLIVEYAYTGSVVVTEENALELLAGADHFAVKGVTQACCVFLAQHFSFKNCIDIWMMADFHRCPDLRLKACLYILRHFEEVAIFSVTFLRLSVQQLAGLLEEDELSVRQESAVFEAVLRWIDHAPGERQGHLATLLSKVRLLLMPGQYLIDTVSTNALVLASCPCMAMLIQAMNTLRESNMERPLTRPRQPSAVLLAIGGWENNFPTDRIDSYDVRADCWERANNMEDPRAFHDCVFLGGFLYCVGGYDGVRHLRTVHKLNLATQTWQEVQSMTVPRSRVSVVALNGCIYAMGGCNGVRKHRTAERYQPDANQWDLIAPMRERRSDAVTAMLHGKVYVCGGLNPNGPLSTAECYNPQSHLWNLIAPMEMGFYAAGGVAYKDKIYVVGGYRGGSPTSRVLAYDPLSNQWSAVNPMINPRFSFGIAVLEDRLYVAGGFNNGNTICNVERYDENTNSWQTVRDMETLRAGFSLCVVERNAYAAA